MFLFKKLEIGEFYSMVLTELINLLYLFIIS